MPQQPPSDKSTSTKRLLLRIILWLCPGASIPIISHIVPRLPNYDPTNAMVPMAYFVGVLFTAAFIETLLKEAADPTRRNNRSTSITIFVLLQILIVTATLSILSAF